jgi:hypothetical protein
MKIDRRFSLFAMSFGTLACDGSDAKVTVIEDAGSVCLTQAGAQVRIAAILDACDGGCNRIRHASCEAAVTADGVVVSSRVEQVDESEKRDICNTECSPARADCAFAAPGDGPVLVSFGTEEAIINLPLASPTRLFGSYDTCPSDN